MTEFNNQEKPLYDRLTDSGCEISHDGDTLLVVATPEARQIVKDYEQEGGTSNMTTARGEDGRLWMALRWHYLPFWNEEPEAPSIGM